TCSRRGARRGRSLPPPGCEGACDPRPWLPPRRSRRARVSPSGRPSSLYSSPLPRLPRYPTRPRSRFSKALLFRGLLRLRLHVEVLGGLGLLRPVRALVSLHDPHLRLALDVGVEPDPDLVGAQLLDRVVEED